MRAQQLSKVRSPPPPSTLSTSTPLKGRGSALDKLTLAEAVRDGTSSSSGNTSGSSSSDEDEARRPGLDASEETEREFTAPVRGGASIEVPLVDLVTVKRCRRELAPPSLLPLPTFVRTDVRYSSFACFLPPQDPSADFEIIPPIKSIIALDDDEFFALPRSRTVNKNNNSTKSAITLDEDDEEDWDILAGSEIIERVASSSK